MSSFTLLIFVFQLWLAIPARASTPTIEILGHPIGVEEDSDRIVHTVDKNFEGKEIMIVFKQVRDGIVWKLENRNKENALVSSIEKYKDGRQVIKNFGSKGSVVSMVEVDRTGKSKITNFKN